MNDRIAICTYWWRPDPGSKFAAPYTVDDVRSLQRMVAKHLTVPHEFLCITDQPDLFANDTAIRAVPIDDSTHVPGRCFVRLMTFHPNGRSIFGADKLLQIDLDTLIVGNMDHLVARDDNLVLWRNPGRVPWEGGLGAMGQGRPYYNASMLLHRCGSMPDIWESFDPRRPPAKDDQWYLSDVFGMDCPYFDGTRDGVYRIARVETPGSGVDGELPANACIVTFPGSCGKPSDAAIRAANPWIEKHVDKNFSGWA